MEGGEDSVVKDLTKEGVEAVKEKFKSVSDVIDSAPSLTGDSAEDPALPEDGPGQLQRDR